MLRRIRFTIRFGLVVITILAVVFAYALTRIRRYEQIVADVEALQRMGAIVDLGDGDESYFSKYAEGFQGVPTYVRKYSDSRRLRDVDAFLDRISRNGTIEKLMLEGTEITDDHAARALSLPLDSLGIRECGVGENLRAPASSSLEWLQFARTRLNDRSLMALGMLPNVKHLDLTRTRVTDRSIDYLASLPSLKSLNIRRCQITRAGKERLEQLRPDVNVAWEAISR